MHVCVYVRQPTVIVCRACAQARGSDDARVRRSAQSALERRQWFVFRSGQRRLRNCFFVGNFVVGFSDPFCTITLVDVKGNDSQKVRYIINSHIARYSLRLSLSLSSKATSKTIDKTLNPVWKEKFAFNVEATHTHVRIELRDRDRLSTQVSPSICCVCGRSYCGSLPTTTKLH